MNYIENNMMKWTYVIVLVGQLILTYHETFGFAPKHSSSTTHRRNLIHQPSSMSTSKMILYLTPEELLAKAHALRQEAEAEESSLHSTLLQNKSKRDQETDEVIKDLFSNRNVRQVASKIQERRLSSMMLERVVDRLNEREIAARGLDHVEHGHSTGTFERVREKDDKELKMVEGLIQTLIQAAEVVDEIVLKERAEKEKRGENVRHTVDFTHWSSGELGKHLREKAKFLGREHDEQWKKRMEDYYKAAKKKKEQHHSEEQFHW